MKSMISRRLGRMQFLQGRRVIGTIFSFPRVIVGIMLVCYLSTLKMEAIYSSEMLDFLLTILPYIPESCILHTANPYV
jgi:hypothetical protein